MARQTSKKKAAIPAGGKRKTLTLTKETLQDLKPDNGIKGGGTLGGGSRRPTVNRGGGAVYGGG